MPAYFTKNDPSPIGEEINKNTRVLIVDDDDLIRDTLEEMVTALGKHVRTFASPLVALAHVKATFYHLILLDISMPELSGLELLPRMKALSPASKFIMITGCANKENATQAFRRGAFDFLEKPVSIELLSQALNRALRMQQTEFKLVETLDRLEQTSAELTIQKRNQEHMKEWLGETNSALSTLVRNLENTRLESEQRVAETARKLMLPIIAKLSRDEVVCSRCTHELKLLTHHIEDMTQDLASDKKITILLSQTELRVASMIKVGMSTQEIAEHLNVSPYTIKTHRRNIRKKLSIKNSKYNLKTYLTNESAENGLVLTLKK